MLKTSLLASTIALATVLATPGASFAEQHGGMHDKGAAAFKSADKDNDGTLDKEEAKAMPNVAKNFEAIDADKDGTVSMDEIHKFMKARQGAMHDRGAAAFKKADKDNDGTLDKEEAKAMPNVAKNFEAIDADKDGTVSMEEIHNFMMKAHHQGNMGGKGAAAFKGADKDNDGTLDKEEAKAMPNVAKNFEAIDADKDGTVSMEEIHNFMMKDHHQGGMHQQ